MAVPFLDLMRQNQPLQAELMKALETTLQSNAYILGPAVARFEQQFAQAMRTGHAVGVNSGTDALLMTLHALGLEPGGEVIVPAFGFVATADVVPRIGANPVFCDINEDFTIDVDQVRSLINERTRAVIAVHLYGRAADVVALQQICNEYGIHLVEDVCQACGAEVDGRALGTWGIAGCFSFYPTKNLGGFGDGGMVITENDELAARLRLYRDHGRDGDGVFQEIGYNSRLDSLQAALLEVKLSTLDEDNADRLANASFYREHLKNDAFTLPSPAPEGAHVYNLFTIRHPQRDHLRQFLKDRQVETGVYYRRALHREPCFEYLGYQEGQFPVAERMAREVLSLPICPGLTRQELDEVAHALDLFAQTYSAPTAG